MRVAFYSNAQDSIPRVQDLTWPELVTLLTTHRRSKCPTVPCPGRCPVKNGPAWSPVDITERRRNENVRAVTVAVFDLDHLTDEQVDALPLESCPYAWVLHSTHSHKPGDTCFRLAMPLSRPVLPSEWASVRAAAIRQLKLPADPATKDLARIYFLPDAPEGVEAVSGSAPGAPLDVDALLADARTGLEVRAAPAPVQDAPTDMHELGALLRRHCRPENRALVGRVLRGEAFAPIGQQDTTLQTLMSTVAFCLPDDTSDDAVIHVLRPSFAATDWQDGFDHLVQEALKKLHRARERKAARDAKRLEENRAIRERLGWKEPAETPATVDEGDEDPDAWMGALLTSETKGETKIRNCEANVELVLRCSPEWRDVLRFNAVSKEIECRGGPIPNLPNLDVLESEVAVWFQRSDYGRLGLMPKPMTVRDAIRSVAYRNTFDPLRDYLEGLHWDGTGRVDGFLERYFGAKGDARYLRAVGPRWLISAVARALRPGCKVDTMLILEGAQGLKKSTALRVLGAGWFCDAPIDIGSKDSWALASQFWILEFAEMKDVRRADVEALKAFLSRSEDTYRPPYGRVNVRMPRRSVNAGSANGQDYLKHDPTGYRRIWPVMCTQIDIEALRKDRDQLWAEAVVRFQQGEQWWLTDDEARLAEEQAAARTEDTGGPDAVILEWLLRQVAERRTELTTDGVAVDALQMQVGHVSMRVRQEVGQAMRRLGFERTQRRVAGVVTWVYRAPANILSAPQQGPK